MLLLPEVEPVVDRSGLAEIFMLGPARSPGHAVFRDLAELPPACYLTYDHGTLQVHRYWKLHAAPHTDSPAGTIERTHQLVTAAAYSFGLIVFALFGALFFLQKRAARGLN